jgi:RNA polymerase sigma-70 factor (ECF subfamily)
MASTTEAALLSAARSGDRQALESLLEGVAPRLLRFSRRMCRDTDEAEDVLQDSMLAVARNLKGFRGDSSLSTWLYAIARSYCIKKRRKSKFAPRVVSLASSEGRDSERVADHGPGPLDRLEKARLRSALDEAIGGLTPAYRDVLLLRDVEGLSAEETGAALSLTVAAVKSRLHRARAAVRDELAPLLARDKPAHPPCPDVVLMLSRHLEGEIDKKTCAAMEAHLEDCPRCRDSCRTLREALGLCKTTPLPRLPRALKRSIQAGLQELEASPPARGRRRPRR